MRIGDLNIMHGMLSIAIDIDVVNVTFVKTAPTPTIFPPSPHTHVRNYVTSDTGIVIDSGSYTHIPIRELLENNIEVEISPVRTQRQSYITLMPPSEENKQIKVLNEPKNIV